MRLGYPGPAIGRASKRARSARKPFVDTFARLCETSVCACISCLAPAIATYRSRSIARSYRESSVLADVDDRLRNLVGRRDHLRVRLEVALRGDHVDELLREIHV